MLDFDITTSDSAYAFFNSFMGFSGGEWIERVVLGCDNDIDSFLDSNLDEIASKSIEPIKYFAFHITTSNNDCSEIKLFGIRSLREVLSTDTELNRFLQGKGITFNLDENTLSYFDKEYDVDYSHCKKTDRKNLLVPIAHRLCYDPQVNGFFCCAKPDKYSTIHRYPELLIKIENCFPSLSSIGNEWATGRTPYIIKFAVCLEKIAWYTFYDNTDEYKADLETHLSLKKKLLLLAYNRMRDNDEHYSDQYIYLSENNIVSPNEITGCTPL